MSYENCSIESNLTFFALVLRTPQGIGITEALKFADSFGQRSYFARKRRTAQVAVGGRFIKSSW